MNIFKRIWNILKGTHKVVHNFRVDLNLFLTEHVLDKLDGSEKVDDVERALVRSLLVFLNKQEVDSKIAGKAMELANEHEEDIADVFVEVLGKANRLLAKRARQAKEIK